jgi:hypothetical protein
MSTGGEQSYKRQRVCQRTNIPRCYNPECKWKSHPCPPFKWGKRLVSKELFDMHQFTWTIFCKDCSADHEGVFDITCTTCHTLFNAPFYVREDTLENFCHACLRINYRALFTLDQASKDHFKKVVYTPSRKDGKMSYLEMANLSLDPGYMPPHWKALFEEKVKEWQDHLKMEQEGMEKVEKQEMAELSRARSLISDTFVKRFKMDPVNAIHFAKLINLKKCKAPIDHFDSTEEFLVWMLQTRLEKNPQLHTTSEERITRYFTQMPNMPESSEE